MKTKLNIVYKRPPMRTVIYLNITYVKKEEQNLM